MYPFRLLCMVAFILYQQQIAIASRETLFLSENLVVLIWELLL